MKNISLVSLLLLCSCSTQPVAMSEQQKNETTAGVRLALNDYCNAIASNGLTAEFDYLDQSPGFYWVPPGFSHALTYDEVAAAIKKNAAKYRSVKNTFDSLSVNVLSSEFAAYTGQVLSVMTDTSGHTDTTRLVETGVLVKRRDGWKLLCGQTGIIKR